MVLPLYLAMTAAEIAAISACSFPCAYMACHFSPYSEGLTNIPAALPEGSVLILNDRMSCSGHSANLVTDQLGDAAVRLKCESVLLDFQRPPEPESQEIVNRIVQSLSCPVAVTEGFAEGLSCPVFLAPEPLHQSLGEYLAPWKDREVWLEAALCQEDVLLTEKGTQFIPQFPPDSLTGGFFEENLCCCYHTQIVDDCIRFTLFDTPESLQKKLELAHSLGVSRAVGLWQELGDFSK